MTNELKEIASWYGKLQQSQIAMEECAELTVAISKILRNPGMETFVNLTEEIADVEIMIAQIKYLYKVDDEAVEGFKKAKIERQLKRMEAEGYDPEE